MSKDSEVLTIVLRGKAVEALEEIAHFRHYSHWPWQEKCEIAFEHALSIHLLLSDIRERGGKVFVLAQDGSCKEVLI